MLQTDLIEFYAKQTKDKRGKWLTSCRILSIACFSSTVIVPAENRPSINTALKNFCAAIAEGFFAIMLHGSTNVLEGFIASAL